MSDESTPDDTAEHTRKSRKKGDQLSDPVYDPVDEYAERPLEEAVMTEEGEAVLSFDPSDPEQQELRLQGSDYVEEPAPELGYRAPVYD